MDLKAEFAGRYYRVHAHVEGDAPVVVSFDGWTPVPDLSSRPFGFDFLRSLGLNVVAVVSGINDWYQNEEVDEMLAAVDGLCGRRPRASYGISMGGYAALNFADRLRVEKAFVFSPQFSVDPTRVPFEDRWISDRSKIRYDRDMIGNTSPTPGWIIYDPFEWRDRRHAQLILDRHPLQALCVPFGGHRVLEYLSLSGILSTIASSMMLGTLAKPEAVALRRQTRQRNYFYWQNRSSRFSGRDRRAAALGDARQAVALAETSASAQLQLAECLYASGFIDDATGIWRRGRADPSAKKGYEYEIRLMAQKWNLPTVLDQVGLVHQ